MERGHLMRAAGWNSCTANVGTLLGDTSLHGIGCHGYATNWYQR